MYNDAKEDTMTYTKPEIDTSFNMIPGEDIAVRAKKMQAAAQLQASKDIDRLKAMGEPIYYQSGKQLIREESDGRKFEYRLRADGTEEILGELA
jgi:predicted DNA-binding transcriptional regulator YafY